MQTSFSTWLGYSALAAITLSACGLPQPVGQAPGSREQNVKGRTPGYQLKAVSGSHAITTRPLSNSVLLEGYTDTTGMKIELLRVDRTVVPIDFTKMVVIATARGTVDAAGRLGVNLKGGVCFDGLTPTIFPDDVVRVTLDNGAFDESKVAQVTCIRPRLEGSTLAVHGTATTGFFNDRLPLEQVEVQLVSKTGAFAVSGTNVLKAASAGVTGTLGYDAIPVNPGDLTAAFNGLSGADIARGLSADVRIVWLGANPGAGNEATIFELLADPGAVTAVLPGCFPGIANAITSTDHLYITPANAATDIAFAGTAAPDVSEVSISVNQGPPVTAVIAQNFLPSVLQKAWSLTVPAAQIGPVSGGGGGAGGGGRGGGGVPLPAPPGSYAVVATFTTFAGPPTTLGAVAPALGFFRMTLPDVSAGPTIMANPSGGSFTTPQAVSLTLLPRAGQVFYTTDGSMPTTASNVYQGQPILLKDTTTLHYFAQLPDGSTTPVQTAQYTIGIPTFVNANPPGGTYFISQYVNLSMRQPGSIFYTLDGTTPTTASPRFAGTPILINRNKATTTLNYMAVDVLGRQTPVVTSSYTINDVVAPSVEAKPFALPPVVTRVVPLAGSSPAVQLFASEDATIYYTTDGSQPSTSSTAYDGRGVVITPAMITHHNPLHVWAATLNFMAVDLAGNQSATISALYKL